MNSETERCNSSKHVAAARACLFSSSSFFLPPSPLTFPSLLSLSARNVGFLRCVEGRALRRFRIARASALLSCGHSTPSLLVQECEEDTRATIRAAIAAASCLCASVGTITQTIRWLFSISLVSSPTLACAAEMSIKANRNRSSSRSGRDLKRTFALRAQRVECVTFVELHSTKRREAEGEANSEGRSRGGGGEKSMRFAICELRWFCANERAGYETIAGLHCRGFGWQPSIQALICRGRLLSGLGERCFHLRHLFLGRQGCVDERTARLCKLRRRCRSSRSLRRQC